jgi:uncharacterized membrane protein YcaP (DUF421 family)
MDFLGSQQSLTSVDWILRGIVSFIFLLIVAKMMGQRSISQLRFLDFIMALTLGNIIAHPLSDEQLGMKGSMITTVVLIVLYVAATWLSLKWPLFKRYLDPPAVTLVKDGKINYRNLGKAKISIDYLFSELRKANVEDIQKVALAAWEPGGMLSVFLHPKYQPVTPADLKLQTPPFRLIRPIIMDGKIDKTLITELGKNQQWLEINLAPTYNNIRDVKLATVDAEGNVRVY